MPSAPRRPGLRGAPSQLARIVALSIFGWLAVAALAHAGPRVTSGKTPAKKQSKRAHKGLKTGTAATGAGGHKGRATGQGSLWLFSRPSNVVPNQQGKVVVFAFRNDDGDELSTQVGQLLAARGLELVPGVRPVDTPEQFRDVATHLALVGYVDGDVRGTDAKTRLTIRVRSGFTGRHVSQAVFTDSRANLARELSDKLWTKLAPSIAHACTDATKPRKASRNTLQINAGTPLTASE